uniref:Uncharacterized protein n=1 Tax=Rhizophora mucronata TaxID=61149 RepID=A0A2P2N965_RHIMU
MCLLNKENLKVRFSSL